MNQSNVLQSAEFSTSPGAGASGDFSSVTDGAEEAGIGSVSERTNAAGTTSSCI